MRNGRGERPEVVLDSILPLRPRLGTSRHRGRGTPARVQHPPAFHRPVHPGRTRQVRRPQRPSTASPRRRTLPRVIQSGPLNLCVPRAKAIHGAGQMLAVREPLRLTQISRSMPRAGWRRDARSGTAALDSWSSLRRCRSDGAALAVAVRCGRRRCAHNPAATCPRSTLAARHPTPVRGLSVVREKSYPVEAANARVRLARLASMASRQLSPSLVPRATTAATPSSRRTPSLSFCRRGAG
jgi:hypothetical protein